MSLPKLIQERHGRRRCLCRYLILSRAKRTEMGPDAAAEGRELTKDPSRARARGEDKQEMDERLAVKTPGG